MDHCKPTSVPQTTVNNLINNYIVQEMCPLQTVECEVFRELITGLAPGASVMSRPTLGRHLKDQCEQLFFDIKQHLDTAKYVCTTTDAWSTSGRRYLGVTAHWIAEDTLRKYSDALACRRLRGAHSFYVLAESISDIYNEYNLNNNKLIGCMTDNSANFLKAFREFGVVYGEHEDTDDGDVNDIDLFEYFTFDSVEPALNADSYGTDTILPPTNIANLTSALDPRWIN